MPFTIDTLSKAIVRVAGIGSNSHATALAAYDEGVWAGLHPTRDWWPVPDNESSAQGSGPAVGWTLELGRLLAYTMIELEQARARILAFEQERDTSGWTPAA